MYHRLFSVVLFSISMTALAKDYSIVACDYKAMNEHRSSAADGLLVNNDFYDKNYVLRSIVELNSDGRYGQDMGVASFSIGKEGTEVDHLYFCTKNAETGRSYYIDSFQLGDDLKISELVEKGRLTLNLDHNIYMDDEHVATKGSKLVAKALALEDQPHLVDIEVSLTLNICDVTLAEESDTECDTAHEQIKGKFRLTLPKSMSLR